MYFIEVLSPVHVNQAFNCYHGLWMKQMDRCWNDLQGKVQVSSRMLETDVGKVEHLSFTRLKKTGNTSHDYVTAEEREWFLKQFHPGKYALEVYPVEERLVDVMDVYHLWVIHEPEKFEKWMAQYPSEYLPFTSDSWAKDYQMVRCLGTCGVNFYGSRTETYAFPGSVEFPFGIHPDDKQGKWSPRKVPKIGSNRFKALCLNTQKTQR